MKKLIVLVIACLTSSIMFANHWTPVQHPAGTNMGVTCVVVINGVQSESTQLELGAFDQGNVCRGSQMPMDNPFLGGQLYMIQVYGTDGDVFTFKLYDQAEEKELTYLQSPTVSYSDGYGNPIDPYVLEFTGSESTTYELPITWLW